MLSSLTQCINKPFLHRIVPCNKKWVLYNDQQWSAKWLDRDETPKHFSQPNFHQKKVTVTVWWSAASLIHYSFLNSSKTITSEKYAQQINETHQKLQNLQLVLVDRMGPILHDNARLHITQPTLQNLKGLGYQVLSHPPHSYDQQTTPSWSISTFVGKNASTTSRRQKMLSKSLLNLKARIFMLQE